MLGETVSAINAFWDKVEPARDVMTNEALAAYEERLVRQAQEESLRLHVCNIYVFLIAVNIQDFFVDLYEFNNVGILLLFFPSLRPLYLSYLI